MISRCLLVLLLSAVSALAQADLIRDWNAPAGERQTEPRGQCSSLRSLTRYDFSIVSAEAVPASADRPASCRVLGQVQPEIRFEVALPQAWNKRLVMIGNGGYAGENLEVPGRQALRDEAVRKGFAFTQTDTGHNAEAEPLGSFAVSSQKLIDYAFRAVHVTALTAKAVAADYYGAAPARSYFIGCSTGGRQALIAAQRFPADFDGILSMAPVLDFVGTMLNYTRLRRAFDAGPVTAAKLKLAGEVIYAACDDEDGVKDGLIEDPRRCGFQPAAQLPKCTGEETPQCFTEGQIQALQALYSDQVIAGERVFPAWPPGAEAAGPNGRIGWERWLVDEKQSLSELFATSFFQYFAWPKKDPAARLDAVDFERDLPRLGPVRKLLNATDPDLSGLRDRGGKLLMTFGWADPALNPNVAVEYYEAVKRTMGPGTTDFFRLFMMPGVFHCAGGPGCDSAPRFAALVDWVERGKAPDTILATKQVAGKIVRSRPLCLYPSVAKYKGSGSTDEASSFTCAPPDVK